MAISLNGSDTTYNETNNTPDKLVSDYVFYVFQIVVYVTLIGLVSMCGIVANIINVLVFVKQGLMLDSSNVSLCGLAVADMCCSIMLLYMSILWYFIASENHSTKWNPEEVMYLTAGFPYFTFSNTACTISAYIAFERCMCVVFPFKMKTWFTARRSLIVIVCIYVYYIACMVPMFVLIQLRWTPDPMTNDSVLRLTVMSHLPAVVWISVAYYLNSVGLRTIIVLIIVICTHIIAYRVRSSWNWRKSATATPTSHAQNTCPMSSKSSKDEIKHTDISSNTNIVKNKTHTTEKMSSKETTLIKMILAISTIFIICCGPDILSYGMIFVEELRSGGQHRNLFYVLYSVKFFIESINSSVNIFVYYNMSTRYRNVFRNGYKRMLKKL